MTALALAALLLGPAHAQEDKPTPEEEIASFRESVLTYFGFTDAAAEHLRACCRLEIEDWASNAGGGIWDAQHKTIRLRTLQQEAAVKAFAMAWWDERRRLKPEEPAALLAAVARLAKDKDAKEAAGLARRLLKEEAKDADAFGALAAWTMGSHRTGKRALPDYAAVFLDPLFTGKIYRTPYYEGGVP